MMRNKTTQILALIAVISVALAGCGNRRVLAVSEIMQNASSLDGRRIRVRGHAYLWIEPSMVEMWRFGGCAINPDGSLSDEGEVRGWLALYEQVEQGVTPRDEIRVTVSESGFHCDGNYCKMTCSPFEVITGRAYELVGRLRINEEQGKRELILEDIDLQESKQFVEGEWVTISTGDFGFGFP